MTASLLDAHQAIADQLAESIVDTRAKSFPPQSTAPPVTWVQFDIGGAQTMRNGVNTYTFNVYVITGTMGDRSGYEALIAYLDPEGDRSIRAAIVAGNTTTGYRDLTGVNVSAIDVRAIGMEDIADFTGYGAVFPVTVTITKG